MVNAIVCVDENWGIGYQGKLLANIPEDMKFFKEKTNNSMVIMGRKTYDSLQVKPLPNRINVVITSDINDENYVETRKDGTLRMNMESAKTMLENSNMIPWDIYIIGGASIYKELLSYCKRVYITGIHHAYENVDSYFPNIDDMHEWEFESISEIKGHNGIKYQFCTYRKKDA